jgi:hypothetical protein
VQVSRSSNSNNHAASTCTRSVGDTIDIAIRRALLVSVVCSITLLRHMCCISLLFGVLADNESLAARVAGQALSKADVNRMVAER